MPGPSQELALPKRRTDVLEAEAIGRQFRRVHSNTHAGLLASTDAHQTDARQLRHLLNKNGVREIFDLGQWKGLRRQCQRQYRCVRRIDLVVNRRIRQIPGKLAAGRIDRSLHFLLGDIDIQVEHELKRDD